MATSRIALADNFDRADLGAVHCETDGVHMSWRTENEGQAAAPDGWKIERSHQNSEGNQVVRTLTFFDKQGAVLTANGKYRGRVDTSANRNVLYTYRVRAINADGSDMNGRVWSRNALVECSADPNVQPGISELRCQDDGVSMF